LESWSEGKPVNIQHSTFNAQRRRQGRSRCAPDLGVKCWALNVKCFRRQSPFVSGSRLQP